MCRYESRMSIYKYILLAHFVFLFRANLSSGVSLALLSSAFFFRFSSSFSLFRLSLSLSLVKKQNLKIKTTKHRITLSKRVVEKTIFCMPSIYLIRIKKEGGGAQ